MKRNKPSAPGPAAPPRREGVSNERGAALVLALLVVALLTVLILELDADARREYREAAVFRDNLKATMLARSAVQLARVTLQEDFRKKASTGAAFDARGDLWAQPLTDHPLGDGTVTAAMEDERGKLNLNALAGGAEMRTAQMARLRRLFLLLQLDPALVDTLADWIDDNGLPEPNGAESPYYQSLTPPYRAANMALQTLSELHLVKGFTADIVRRLAPHVTLYPAKSPDAWINLNTATAEVIQALDPRITRETANEIIAGRPYRTVQEPDRIGSFEPLAKELRLSDGYQVKTDHFSVRMKVAAGGLVRAAQAVLRRSGKNGESELLYFRIE
jgi:general secretion pathway protein K